MTLKEGDGTNEINIVERDRDPSRYDLNRAMSLMKNGKIVISYGTEPGKALSIMKEKRIKGKNELRYLCFNICPQGDRKAPELSDIS